MEAIGDYLFELPVGIAVRRPYHARVATYPALLLPCKTRDSGLGIRDSGFETRQKSLRGWFAPAVSRLRGGLEREGGSDQGVGGSRSSRDPF